MDSTKSNIERLRFPRFFLQNENLPEIGSHIILTGGDVKHISSVLRMKAGDKAVLCDKFGFDYPSEIVDIKNDSVEFYVLAKRENDAEPSIYFRLFQCVPKSDKLDLIVQKATELGVSEIFPIISKRCISRPVGKSGKIQRLQKIAEQAAKQSGRGKIPVVNDFTSFSESLGFYKKDNLGIIFYENGGERINDIIKTRCNIKKVDIFIGSEGGFETLEIDEAMTAGLTPASLGKLILRTETAPIAAISILMNLTGQI